MPLPSNPSQPLKLEDGSEITPIYKPSSSRSTKFTEVPTHREAQRQITSVRRQLSDMPLPPKQLNVVSLICMYTLMGLTDTDISIALGIPKERIETVKMLDAYSTIYNQVVESIIDEESEDIRTAIAAKARRAVDTVGELLDDEFSSVRLAAAKDILDRAGHRPVDTVEHRHTMEGDLRIVVTRADDVNEKGLTIDAEDLPTS